jgi:hypothetical protein
MSLLARAFLWQDPWDPIYLRSAWARRPFPGNDPDPLLDGPQLPEPTPDEFLFETLSRQAAGKFRFSSAEELSTSRLPDDSLQVNVGTQALDPVLHVLRASMGAVTILGPHQRPAGLGQVRVFEDLMPGEIWVECVVPASLLAELLAEDAVLFIEPAQAGFG